MDIPIFRKPEHTYIVLLIIAITLMLTLGCNVSRVLNPNPTPYQAPTTPEVYIPIPPNDVTTVLLLATDRRPSGGSNNTDTLMLFMLDPNQNRIAILSLPRDLYVEIPGHGSNRINTAYASGGLDLARQTVYLATGVPIEHTVLINFDVFVTLIDAIGGIDVDVPYTINDPTYPDHNYGYDPFYLTAGQHHLDGATALQYARTRATPSGDFDRSARQRQVVMAVRDRVLQLNMLPSLIAQAPQLWNNLQSSYETDMSIEQVLGLALAAGQVPTENITSAGVDYQQTNPWTTPDGAEVLLIDRAAFDALIEETFYPPTPTPAAQ